MRRYIVAMVVLAAAAGAACAENQPRPHGLGIEAALKPASVSAAKICYVYLRDVTDELGVPEVVRSYALGASSTTEDCKQLAQNIPHARDTERVYVSLGCWSRSGISIGEVFRPAVAPWAYPPKDNTCNW